MGTLRCSSASERAGVEARVAQTQREDDVRQIRLLVPYPARLALPPPPSLLAFTSAGPMPTIFSLLRKSSRASSATGRVSRVIRFRLPLDLAQRVKARCGGNDNEEADRDKREEQPAPQSGDEPGERRERTHPRRPQRAQMQPRSPGADMPALHHPANIVAIFVGLRDGAELKPNASPGETHILCRPPDACGTSRVGRRARGCVESQPRHYFADESVIIAAVPGSPGRRPFSKILPKCRDRGRPERGRFECAIRAVADDRFLPQGRRTMVLSAYLKTNFALNAASRRAWRRRPECASCSTRRCAAAPPASSPLARPGHWRVPISLNAQAKTATVWHVTRALCPMRMWRSRSSSPITNRSAATRSTQHCSVRAAAPEDHLGDHQRGRPGPDRRHAARELDPEQAWEGRWSMSATSSRPRSRISPTALAYRRLLQQSRKGARLLRGAATARCVPFHIWGSGREGRIQDAGHPGNLGRLHRFLQTGAEEAAGTGHAAYLCHRLCVSTIGNDPNDTFYAFPDRLWRQGHRHQGRQVARR